ELPAVSLPRAARPPLTLQAEVVRRRLPDNRQIWEIAGTIGNPTERSQPVPPVEILLLDGPGRIAGRWTVRPEAQNVAAGGAVRFETTAIDPPASARRLRMQLKPAELGRL
ncbi:MAG: FxLYD domain-containing protein, partial [Sandaracinobacteroides sp.]